MTGLPAQFLLILKVPRAIAALILGSLISLRLIIRIPLARPPMTSVLNNQDLLAFRGVYLRPVPKMRPSGFTVVSTARMRTMTQLFLVEVKHENDIRSGLCMC
jgi:hypothetical protein